MIKIREIDRLVLRVRGSNKAARVLLRDSWLCSRAASRRARPASVESETLPRRLLSVQGRLAAYPLRVHQIFAPIGLSGVLAFGLLFSTASAAEVPPIKIAVFNFELEDLSPAASYLDKTTSAAATMEKVSREARQALAQSGSYVVIDPSTVDAKPVIEKALRNCDGCEAGIALRLGADESLFGVVRKATQTDYYVVIQIRDARTGKLINQQEANFAGSEEGWPTGVRMLIKHQILVSEQP